MTTELLSWPYVRKRFASSTVMILSFQTDRPEQTVDPDQTAPNSVDPDQTAPRGAV